jgi:threonine/homoserine/homoserine lactone efflux protein
VEALLIGLGIGLGAGVSPGPLLTLVISSTLERGFGAGLRVAAAPLVTDLPVIAVTLWLLGRLGDGFLISLALLGGVVVIAVGLETAWKAWRPRAETPGEGPPKAHDLWRGALVNILSPHPWIFWLTLLGPQAVGLWRQQPPIAVGFVALFYVGLVGSKIAIAWAVARGRRHLQGRWYRIILALCAGLLIVLGVLLIAQGTRAALGGEGFTQVSPDADTAK